MHTLVDTGVILIGEVFWESEVLKYHEFSRACLLPLEVKYAVVNFSITYHSNCVKKTRHNGRLWKSHIWSYVSNGRPN